ncbi:MAG: hypothetical protein ABIO16_05325 [Nocardioides sp.]
MIRAWRTWTAGQWALRAAMVLGPLVAIFARTGPLGAPPAWLVVVVVVMGAGWALLPESILGAITLLVVGLAWASGQDEVVPAAAVVAALAMLAAHLAALVVGYGPPRLPVAPAVVRLWALRGACVFVAAPVVWLLGRTVRDLPGSGSAWVVGMVVAFSVTIVAAAATQSALPRGDDE